VWSGFAILRVLNRNKPFVIYTNWQYRYRIVYRLASLVKAMTVHSKSWYETPVTLLRWFHVADHYIAFHCTARNAYVILKRGVLHVWTIQELQGSPCQRVTVHMSMLEPGVMILMNHSSLVSWKPDRVSEGRRKSQNWNHVTWQFESEIQEKVVKHS
jgi:hypothetical protein